MQPGAQQFDQAIGDVGVLAGVETCLLLFHCGEADLLLALADQFLDRLHLVAEVVAGHRFQAVLAVSGIEEVVGDHGVKFDAARFDVVMDQDAGVVLEVLTVFVDAGLFEQGFEELQDLLAVQIFALSVAYG